MKVQNDYYPNGNLQRKIYFQDGQIHREGGPAVIEYDDDGKTVRRILFFKHNKVHRWHLPAIIHCNENGHKEIEFYDEGMKKEDALLSSMYRMLEAVLGGDPEELLAFSPDNSAPDEANENKLEDESDTSSGSTEG